MASLKIKFRISSVDGKEGSIYYQVIHNRVVRQIRTDYKIFENEWDYSKSKIVIGNNRRRIYLLDIIDRIDYDVRKINNIIKTLDDNECEYASDDVVSMNVGNSNRNSMFTFMLDLIQWLRKMNRCGTADTYSATLKSFMVFRGGVDLLFTDIDSNLMVMYENFLKDRCLKKNSISFYMRILRAVYNRAIEKNLTEDNHPFKHVSTGIYKTIKRAISLSDVRKIKNLDIIIYPNLDFARDMFMFSFYTRGMSFIDMAFLKKSNISNGCIVYRRRKTGQQLTIRIERCMSEIINKYGSDGISPYLLPIIMPGCQDERVQYKNVLGNINKNLKKIACMAKISNNLSMYVARHSWASCARNNNIPLSVISESMGHDSEVTTQIYLSSLDNGVIDNANRQIIDCL